MPVKKPASKSVKKRKLDKPNYSSFKLQKRIKHPDKVMGSFRLLGQTIQHLFRHKRVFFGVLVIYMILSVTFVTGFFSTSEYSTVKEVLDSVFSGTAGQLTTGFALFSLVVSGGVSASSETGGVYQVILMILMSLAVIWLLRHTHAKQKVTLKLSFYKSTYPLVPFLFVLLVIGLQFIPLLAGVTIYSIVLSQGLAVTAVEKFLWPVLVICLGLLTLYMISSSLFALYIVTLPEMYPMRALRSARELVRYRRWTVMRKVVFLPLVYFVATLIIMMPILLYVTFLAQWVFLLLSIIAVLFTHTYMYKLYRELL